MFLYLIGAIVMVLTFRLLASFNLDESGMVFILQFPLGRVLTEYTNNLPMISIYEVFMWVWLRCVAFSEFGARVPSLLAFLGTLIVIHRIAKENELRFPGKNKQVPGSDKIAPLILAAMPQMQHFATTARPYAAAIFLCALSLLNFLRWRRTNTLRYLQTAGLWLAIATLIKIFSLLQLGALVLVLFWSRGFFRAGRSLLALVTLPLLAFIVQLPLILHFQRTAALHQSSQPADFFLFRLLVLEPVFVPYLSGAIMAVAILMSLLYRRKIQWDKPGLLMFGLVSAFAPLMLGIVTWLTNVFVLSEKYVLVAYVPFALFAAKILSDLSRTVLVGVAWIAMSLYLGSAGMMSALTLDADTEDWRRAFRIAKSMESTEPLRAPAILFSSGFFEAEHREFEGHPFLEAPARLYPVSGALIAVPNYNSIEMTRWIEENLLTDRILEDPRPILFISKMPSAARAQRIATMIGRRFVGISFSQVQVWLLFR